MVAVERGAGWVSATVDLLSAVFGLVLAAYPPVSLGNAAPGSPASAPTVGPVVGAVAVGGAYAVVAGEWSLGRVGEYVPVPVASAFGRESSERC